MEPEHISKFCDSQVKKRGLAWIFSVELFKVLVLNCGILSSFLAGAPFLLSLPLPLCTAGPFFLFSVHYKRTNLSLFSQDLPISSSPSHTPTTEVVPCQEHQSKAGCLLQLARMRKQHLAVVCFHTSPQIQRS
jgi:hypothetical protein